MLQRKRRSTLLRPILCLLVCCAFLTDVTAGLGDQAAANSHQAPVTDSQPPVVDSQASFDKSQAPSANNHPTDSQPSAQTGVQSVGQAPQSNVPASERAASDQQPIAPTHGPLSGRMRPPQAKPASWGPPPPSATAAQRMPLAPHPPKRPRLPLFLAPSSETSDAFDGAEASFVYILPSRHRQCFHHRSAKSFAVEFRVMHGGQLDADAYVVGPDGRIVFESRGRRQARYIAPAVSRTGGSDQLQLPLYTICLDNRYSSWYAKVIDFSIQLPRRARGGAEADDAAADSAAAAAAAAAAQGPLPEDLTAQLDQLNLSWTQFLSLTDAVENNLHQSAHFQRQFRRDEVTDRMAMEDSASCVTQWSLMQLLVMICVSALQVLMIRAFFDEKSLFHRIWRSRGSFIMRS